MDSLSEVWQEVLQLCRDRVPVVLYNIWLVNIEPQKLENDTVVFVVNTDFKKNIINEKFDEILRQAFYEVLGFKVTLDVIVSSSSQDTSSESNESPVERHMQEYSFDNFVVGSSNSFAHAACRRVATVPGVQYNPLLIYGRSGLGKTHLMLAVKNELQKRNPDAVIMYTTGENFTNELILCIAEKSTAAFHNKYRNVDALLVDDIQFIQKKVSTQEEFFHTFDTLTNMGKQIVLTSDRPPKEIETLDERLRTRFEMGLIADIQPPDIDTRIAIIKRKSQQIEFVIPETVAELIASKLKSNIRQLEGTVKKLSAMYKINGLPPTVELASKIIEDIVSDSKPVSVIIDKIFAEVSSSFGVSVEDMKSDKRLQSVTNARQLAMYIIREVTGMPLTNIGLLFGGKNHATVHHSINKAEDNITKDAQLRVTVDEIMKNIRD